MAQLKPLRHLRDSLHARVARDTGPRAEGSAVVFAPHQDDETLGCGGTIILKRQAGTPVTVVFMTDGSTSHKRFMDEGELRRLRKAEALEAAEVLGVPSRDVHFLDFPDGRLDRYHEPATSQVLALLNQHQPDEVFVPYHRDGTPDHEATYKIVEEAVQMSALTLRVHEYPVWLWNQWPWVPLNLACSREAGKAVWRAVRSGFGLTLFREFKSGVLVRDVLARKREALAKHRSQTAVLKPDVGWPTLSDVSQGQFLSCFFQEYEVYVSAHRCPSPS